MAIRGSLASFCDLVVSDFPPNRRSIESDSFKLADSSVKHLHYYLNNNFHLNVNIRSKITDSKGWFPKSKLKSSEKNTKVLYFEIRGQVPSAGILQVVRFLGLYSPQTYSSTERDMDLEAFCSVSISQSANLLQDMSRVTLLRDFCSGMNYESAEDLQGILLNTLMLRPKELLIWLGRHPNTCHLNEKFIRFLEEMHLRARGQLEILRNTYVGTQKDDDAQKPSSKD